jgi:hypothetical protein
MLTPVASAHRIIAPKDDELALRHNALTQPYTLTSNTLLERQAARESNARSYPRRIPLALKRVGADRNLTHP